MAHQFNFEQVFTPELKKEIIKKRAEKYVTKFGKTPQEALKRAKAEMMPARKYKKYAFLASKICRQLHIPTNSDTITISTNRNGQHSWYIKVDSVTFGYHSYEIVPFEIRISDHDQASGFKSDICIRYDQIYSYRKSGVKEILANALIDIKEEKEGRLSNLFCSKAKTDEKIRILTEYKNKMKKGFNAIFNETIEALDSIEQEDEEDTPFYLAIRDARQTLRTRISYINDRFKDE